MSILCKIKNWFDELIEKEQHLPVYITALSIIAILMGGFSGSLEIIAATGLIAIVFLLFCLLVRLNVACEILWLVLKAQPTVKVTSTKEQKHENM